MGRLTLALESLGAVDPSRGHPAPGRFAFRVPRELRHLVAFRGMFEKFVARVHRPFSPRFATTDTRRERLR